MLNPRVLATCALAIVAVIVSCSPAMGGILYAIANNGTLSTIDTDTYSVSSVGSLGVGNTFWTGAEYDGANDRLLVVDGDSGTRLFSVNVNTGAASLIGSHGIQRMFGLAMDNNGVVYASQLHDSKNLYRLNTTTAAATLVGSVAPGLGSLAYDSTRDMLVGLTDFNGNTLVSVDRNTGALTVLKSGLTLNDTGLAYDPDKDLYWGTDNLNGGRLYSFDPNNGFAFTVNAINIGGGTGGFQGLAYRAPALQAVPEPSSLCIFLGLGAIGLAVRSRVRRKV